VIAPRSTRVAAACHLPARTIEYVRAGREPRAGTVAKLEEGARRLIREILRAAGQTPSHEPHHMLAAWASLSADARVGGGRRCEWPDCEKPLSGRQRRYCSEAHRKRHERQQAAAQAGPRAASRRLLEGGGAGLIPPAPTAA
jgi:hypothetical protein